MRNTKQNHRRHPVCGSRVKIRKADHAKLLKVAAQLVEQASNAPSAPRTEKLLATLTHPAPNNSVALEMSLLELGLRGRQRRQIMRQVDEEIIRAPFNDHGAVYTTALRRVINDPAIFGEDGTRIIIPVDPATCQVWAALPYGLNGFAGYLVTAPGNLNALIALVPPGSHRDSAFDLAHEIAADPAIIDYTNNPVIDLRIYGRAYDGPAVPTFILSLWCAPATEGERIYERGAALRQPNPIDKARLRQWLDRICDEEFATDKLKYCPCVCLAIEGNDSGFDAAPLYYRELISPSELVSREDSYREKRRAEEKDNQPTTDD